MSTLIVARFQHVREENEISISVQRLKEEATRMSKSEFLELIPNTRMDMSRITSSHSDHTKDTSGLVHGHDAQHWYNAYMALYKLYHDDTESLRSDLEQALALLESMNQTSAQMEAEIKRLKKKKKKHSKQAEDECSDGDSEPETTSGSYFKHGMGLDLQPGVPPKLYDLSDPEGTTPKKKFGGVTLEVQPGRGFAVRVKKTDK